MYITIEILITSLSPLFSAIYDHIRVEGNAINWTSIRAIIIELVSNPKFKANVDASAITVWTPSINRKKAIKNIKTFLKLNVEICIVIGGGNIYRGIESEKSGIDRVQGDYMGMLATLMNSMALQSHLEKLECDTRLMSGFNIDQVCEPFIRRRAIRHLEKGWIVIFGAGLGKLSGKIWRIGLMGYNARKDSVDYCLNTLKKVLNK